MRNVLWAVFWVIVGLWAIKHPATVSAAIHNVGNFISTLGNSG